MRAVSDQSTLSFNVGATKCSGLCLPLMSQIG